MSASQSIKLKLNKVKEATINAIAVIKEKALVIIDKIKDVVVKPFKNKKNFKEFVHKMK